MSGWADKFRDSHVSEIVGVASWRGEVSRSVDYTTGGCSWLAPATMGAITQLEYPYIHIPTENSNKQL
ncbi:hypothetical protein [Chamaesiphon minutus]|uniref:Uncharacterized protein n=1 Tax=Chamaesiphon minutus (strain ATCC 27169 / PCC 6605) TaxID=1173020 RepID=K9UBC8_CHAP6|nr:hypothetical protein [Chamaesiphon minutus]AFY91928.1 hypothetical protein Cha6605_0651 [Chamaesiphon minutus PCC 6605]